MATPTPPGRFLPVLRLKTQPVVRPAPKACTILRHGFSPSPTHADQQPLPRYRTTRWPPASFGRTVVSPKVSTIHMHATFFAFSMRLVPSDLASIPGHISDLLSPTADGTLHRAINHSGAITRSKKQNDLRDVVASSGSVGMC